MRYFIYNDKSNKFNKTNKITNCSFKKYDELLKNKKIKITEEKYHKLFKNYFLKSSPNNNNKDLFNKKHL